jgi:hypothetical protein
MNTQTEVNMKDLLSALAIWSLWMSVIGAWFTHIIVCIAASKLGFLIAGALFFPIGIIHGFGIWLGAW